MLVNVGDTRTITWEHYDPDDPDQLADVATVSATLKEATTGAVTTLAVSHTAVGTYEVDAPFPRAGDWFLTFTSTGPAESDEFAVYALPPGMSAPWAPTLRTVAAFIPSRTRQMGTETFPGDNVPALTFNALTHPPGQVVDTLIERAVGLVTGILGTPIVVSAYSPAATAAALWAAYWVELGYPERDAEVQVWAQLRADADAATVSAAAVNVGAGGGTAGPDKDGVPALLTTHSFPDPPGWADVLI